MARKKLHKGITQQDLRMSIRNIVDDVKYNIQYNHAFATSNYREIHKIADITAECICQSIVTAEGIADILIRRKEVYEIATKLAELDSSGAVSIKIGRKRYRAGCAKANPNILREMENEIHATETVLALCSPRTVLVVPKNSDKASNAYRKFVTKPIILEIILGAICNGMDRTVPTLPRIEVNNVSYECYGGRFVSDSDRTFKHYILDYNEYRDAIMKTDDSKHVMCFDISKFFQSINTSRLASVLVANSGLHDKSINSVDFVSSCFTFPVYDLREPDCNASCGNLKPITFNDGLTIETHYQHLMANLYLREMMIPVINRLALNDSSVKIYSYVDDFVIIADTPEMVNITFQTIHAAMQRFGLQVCSQKTSKIQRFGDAKSSIKELIRLPCTNYFEIVSYFFQEMEKVMYVTSDMDTQLSEEELKESITSEEGAKVYELVRTKKDILEAYRFAEKLLMHKDHVPQSSLEKLVDTLYELPVKVRTRTQNAIRGMLRNCYTYNSYEIARLLDFNSNYSISDLYNRIVTFVRHRQYNEARQTSTYWQHVITRELPTPKVYSKAFMYLNDMQYWINNREQFVIENTPEGSEAYIRTLTEMLNSITNSEEKLLETLQQFYLTCLTTDIMTQTLFVTRVVALKKIILEKYPAKTSFLVGIIRKFRKILINLNMMNLITTYTENDEHKCFKVLSESTDSKEINEAYFAYKYFRYDIIP